STCICRSLVKESVGHHSGQLPKSPSENLAANWMRMALRCNGDEETRMEQHHHWRGGEASEQLPIQYSYLHKVHVQSSTDRHVNTTSHGVEQWKNAEHGQSIISKIHEATAEDNKAGLQGLQNMIEGLFVSIKQRTHHLYRQTDSNKRRHRIRLKILDEKRKFSEAIAEYNDLVPDSDRIDSLDFWQRKVTPGLGNCLAVVNIYKKTAVGLYTKKRVFDKVMLLRRLHEEGVILVREMKQHWEYLRRSAGTLRDLASQLSDDLQRISELRYHQDNVRDTYSRIIGLDATILDEDIENEDFESSQYDSTGEDEEKP
ncbi:hypothetical protein HHUSO_G35284, partial [Huso huso]